MAQRPRFCLKTTNSASVSTVLHLEHDGISNESDSESESILDALTDLPLLLSLPLQNAPSWAVQGSPDEPCPAQLTAGATPTPTALSCARDLETRQFSSKASLNQLRVDCWCCRLGVCD